MRVTETELARTYEGDDPNDALFTFLHNNQTGWQGIICDYTGNHLIQVLHWLRGSQSYGSVYGAGKPMQTYKEYIDERLLREEESRGKSSISIDSVRQAAYEAYVQNALVEEMIRNTERLRLSLLSNDMNSASESPNAASEMRNIYARCHYIANGVSWILCRELSDTPHFQPIQSFCNMAGNSRYTGYDIGYMCLSRRVIDDGTERYLSYEKYLRDKLKRFGMPEEFTIDEAIESVKAKSSISELMLLTARLGELIRADDTESGEFCQLLHSSRELFYGWYGAQKVERGLVV